ncbi:type IV pilin N-terminal domain-containing protein [Methanospirillum lacunae]|uniref:Archaeal Type IV pilin N-terminal domain-containing protein n=1 Tax=Methanospirillum lacunae TaxID=668570 RepID=A0A2V2MWD4_9EURY|nr:type IV pilin N-terminal domain-containing protein [Methanospirillum lacunae]PWR70565.1 hypothetical protein DK846_14320 [Methanospirillum lacunae]
MKSERAISEVIGAILLVAIVIAGIGIVGVFMTSTPPPKANQKAILSSSCIDCTGDSFVIVVKHEGGDTIDPKTLKYYLRTEYANGTPFERIQVYGTKFYQGDEFAVFTRDDICSLPSSSISYNNATSMKNGDVVLIYYKMKKS